jgi:glutathione synthase/RimK-type ligase-like ATP-grasp enzyme
VWFRRPRLPDDFDRVAAADLAFVRDEWKRHVENVHAACAAAGDVFWVNRPDRARAAENKLLQLQAAHRCGLRFPATLISSDADEIRGFFAAHAHIIHKPFATHSWRDGAGRIHSTYARTLDAGMLHNDAALRLCPGIYQACVRKRYDLRVTVVGHRLFAVRIDAAAAEDGVVDWRAAAIGGQTTSRPVVLPDPWDAALRRLMDALGLVFGCIDLVADDNDDLHFIEINQAGQFLFVEHDAPGVPLLRAMAAMLAQGRPDYAMETIADVTYADFLEDPEQMAWWASVAPGIRGADGRIPGVSEE